MSTESDKFKHSKRLLKEENAIKKQTKIAKANGIIVKEPHKFAKHHATDCGNPRCLLCSNPRHNGSKDKLTAQEKRLFQELDATRDRHSNGIIPKSDE